MECTKHQPLFCYTQGVEVSRLQVISTLQNALHQHENSETQCVNVTELPGHLTTLGEQDSCRGCNFHFLYTPAKEP